MLTAGLTAYAENMFGVGLSYNAMEATAATGGNTYGVDEGAAGAWFAYRLQRDSGASYIFRVDRFGGNVKATMLDVLGVHTFPSSVYLGGGITITDIDGFRDNFYGGKAVVGGLIETGSGHIDLALEYFIHADNRYSACNTRTRSCSDLDIGANGFVARVGYLF